VKRDTEIQGHRIVQYFSSQTQSFFEKITVFLEFVRLFFTSAVVVSSFASLVAIVSSGMVLLSQFLENL
jgi:hypothetical protein